MSPRNALLIIFAGLSLLIAGFVGHRLSFTGERILLNTAARELLGVEAGDFHTSFVLAGRDIFYTEIAGGEIRDSRGRVIGRTAPAVGNAYGTNTDTIFYVSIVNHRVYMVAIPRDVYIARYNSKINAVYQVGGAEKGGALALKRTVSEILGLDIEHYAIINIDIFKDVVDAIGGVNINVPYRMKHDDFAAGLHIDLYPGSQRLDGEGAADFVRFRGTVLNDYGRIDNIKTLAQALLGELKALNVRAVGRVPELARTVFDNTETDADIALLASFLPHLANLEIITMTLPTYDLPGTASDLGVVRREAERMLAELFGGREREIHEVPETSLLITNRSGVPGLEFWMQAQLVGLGVPEAQLIVRTASLDPAPTRVLANTRTIQDAAFYADLLHIGQQQVVRFDDEARAVGTRLELVLGTDAAAFHGVPYTAQIAQP